MADINTQQFWNDLEDDMWDSVSLLVIEIILAGIEGGVASLPATSQPFINFDNLYARVLEFARSYRFEWIQGITETTRAKTIKAITDWIRSGSPLSALEKALEPLFGEARARRIAITEVTRLFARGNQIAWEETGFITQVRWNTARDELVCPVCRPLDGTLIGIGDIDAFPPAHVNCRCYVTPIVDEKSFEKKIDDILGL